VMQKFKLAAEGHGDHQPPEEMRERVKTYFDPLPFWYPPFEGELVDTKKFDICAIGQRPAHMYHSWGSMNAWLRQLTSHNFLYMHQDKAKQLGLVDGDWVWVESHHSKIKAPIKIMSGVNKDTVWTWNAIGKRRGSWALSDKAPESKKGFLLNHIISDLLPQKKDGYRYSNSDPITGQAAWYDLRVRIEKCADDEEHITSPYYKKAGPGNDDLQDVMAYKGGN